MVVRGSADIDKLCQSLPFKESCKLSFFLSVLALRMAQYHSRKGAILLFCNFTIIPDDMAQNGAFWILDCS
jgi:hypothetical protein